MSNELDGREERRKANREAHALARARQRAAPRGRRSSTPLEEDLDHSPVLGTGSDLPSGEKQGQASKPVYVYSTTDTGSTPKPNPEAPSKYRFSSPPVRRDANGQPRTMSAQGVENWYAHYWKSETPTPSQTLWEAEEQTPTAPGAPMRMTRAKLENLAHASEVMSTILASRPSES